jgi:prepilin-type N-terminal cleavage/methylation domain-containing protein
VRYPILIGQAIGQQIANAPRPQDRNTVAALASKIDAMLAQSRCFVTVQDIDLGLLFGIGLASLKCGRPWTDTAPFPLGPVTMPGITSCWASIVAARGTVHLSRVLSGSGGRRIMATALGAAGRRLGLRLGAPRAVCYRSTCWFGNYADHFRPAVYDEQSLSREGPKSRQLPRSISTSASSIHRQNYKTRLRDGCMATTEWKLTKTPFHTSSRPRLELLVDGRDAGFTLLEILVVITIIGLLIGLVAPAALRQLSGRGCPWLSNPSSGFPLYSICMISIWASIL